MNQPSTDPESALKSTVPLSDPVNRKTFTLTGTNSERESIGDFMEANNKASNKQRRPLGRAQTLSDSDVEDKRYNTLPLPKQTGSQTIEQTDSGAIEQTDSGAIAKTGSGIQGYVAMMKKRGHKRIASAPVPSSPLFDVKVRGRGKGEESDSCGINPDHSKTKSSNTRYIRKDVFLYVKKINVHLFVFTLYFHFGAFLGFFTFFFYSFYL